MLSAAVIGALKYSKYQARHTLDIEFAPARPTIHFLEAMQKWFTLMDVSNCQQYIHCNNDDCRLFSDVDDPRLDWLEHAFVVYIKDLRDASRTENFFSKETCHALIFTTQTNVPCIHHLLTEKQFSLVLTHKMSSDPIKAMFGFFRCSAGCDDALDIRSTICSLKKILRTGIITSSGGSNVQSSASFTSKQLHTIQHACHTTAGTTDHILNI